MGEIVYLSIPTTAAIPPDKILEAAVGKMETVIVVGRTTEGEEYFASSTGDGRDILWLIERCKAATLSHGD